MTFDSQIPLLQSQPQLKNLVRLAVEKAVQELIQVAAERAIKITLQTCEQVIRKDFALDPEEFRMRTAAQNMVSVPILNDGLCCNAPLPQVF